MFSSACAFLCASCKSPKKLEKSQRYSCQGCHCAVAFQSFVTYRHTNIDEIREALLLSSNTLPTYIINENQPVEILSILTATYGAARFMLKPVRLRESRKLLSARETGQLKKYEGRVHGNRNFIQLQLYRAR